MSDFALWLTAQVAALRERRWTDVDVDLLSEEMEDLGNSQRRELSSRISVLLVHLLKVEWQRGCDASASWWSTILTQGGEVERLIASSPSLRREIPREIASQYDRARKIAAVERGVETRELLKTIPERVRRNVTAAIGDRTTCRGQHQPSAIAVKEVLDLVPAVR